MEAGDGDWVMENREPLADSRDWGLGSWESRIENRESGIGYWKADSRQLVAESRNWGLGNGDWGLGDYGPSLRFPIAYEQTAFCRY